MVSAIDTNMSRSMNSYVIICLGDVMSDLNELITMYEFEAWSICVDVKVKPDARNKGKPLALRGSRNIVARTLSMFVITLSMFVSMFVMSQEH